MKVTTAILGYAAATALVVSGFIRNPVQDVVTARGFELVDEGGRTMAFLAPNESGAAELAFLDQYGLRLAVGISTPGPTPMLRFYGPDGETLMMVHADQLHGAGITMHYGSIGIVDRDRKPVFGIYGGPAAPPGIELYRDGEVVWYRGARTDREPVGPSDPGRPTFWNRPTSLSQDSRKHRRPPKEVSTSFRSMNFVTALPDLPRWVEARGMLLSGRGRVLGSEDGPTPAGVVLQPDTRLAVVIGQPGKNLILEAAALADEILAVPDDAASVTTVLSDWTAESAALHVLPDFSSLPDPSVAAVRLLDPGELATIPELPEPLREELALEARAGTPIAAALLDTRPVAFCYAGAMTETLWDVSIDTLEPYRRQGFAARCGAYLIRRLAEEGKRPVWGAAASNAPSAHLAAKLGFTAVDSLIVFTRPSRSTAPQGS